jgi:hypothetical protein
MRGEPRQGRRNVTPTIARGDARLLALVARLPFASTRHLAVLSGEPASVVYRCAARLVERGVPILFVKRPLRGEPAGSRARRG